VRIRRLFRLDRGAPDVAGAVDDELRFHFEMTVAELEKKGFAPADARNEAERRFGNVERTRNGLADIDRGRVMTERRAEWWSGVVQDLRYAVRGIRRKPAFAIAVVATLGLGIGANATMFGIVDRLLFRAPAWLEHAGDVNRIYFARSNGGKEVIDAEVQYRRYLDIAAWTSSFSMIGAQFNWREPVGKTDPAQLRIGMFSANLWQLFTVHPVIGRFFTTAEDVPPDGANVAVLGYGYWQSAYAGRADALGKQLHIGRFDYTIVGVAPRGFVGFSDEAPVAFIPVTSGGNNVYGLRMPVDVLHPQVRVRWPDTYHLTWVQLVARRKAGVSVAAADADLSRAYTRSYEMQVATGRNETPLADTRPRAIAGPVQHERGPNQAAASRVATWLIGVSAIVLLIACANVGNLLLARALRRRKEIAVRLALGVSRRRLLAQLLTESLLLSLLGALAAIAVAQWGGDLLRTTLFPNMTWTSTLADRRVLSFTAAAALFAAVLASLAPALQFRAIDLAGTLKSGQREGTRHSSPLRTSLLVLQATLSMVLVMGAGLFVRSLHNAQAVRLGYDVTHLVYVEPELRGVVLTESENIALHRRLLDASRALPGVADASLASSVPFYQDYGQELFVPGVDSVNKRGEFILQDVSPGYFRTTGTRILRGRGITSDDRKGSRGVIVVSQSMAATVWPRQDAIGQCVKIGADTMPCNTVVGIAEDIRFSSLSKSDPELMYYIAADQFPAFLAGMFVRTGGDAATAVESVRSALQREMPGPATVNATALSQYLKPETQSWQLGATMFTLFGLLALAVAAVGLYSVIAYNVAQRSHEMGVRVALGAQMRDVVGLVVLDGVRVVAVAIVIGGAIAMTAARWVEPLLFETSARDPQVFAAVAVLLGLVAVGASLLPALRAARVDPNAALRAD
jgi:predicted permease